MKLIERRIGLLFAVFLTLLVDRRRQGRLARRGQGRHAQAGRRHPAGGRPDRARPARRDHRPQRHRAGRLPAGDDDRRHAVPDQGPRRASPRASSGLLDKPEDELLRQLARRDTGFVYLARHVPAARARKVQELKVEGLEFIPEFTRVYPREWMASQLLGTVGTDNQGLSGLEYSLDKYLRGRDGERRLVKDALGEAIEMTRDQADRARPGPPPHARRQHPGQGRGGARRRRRGVEAQGRHRDRHGPARRRAARARQLAAGERQRARRRPRLRAPEPRDRRHLRARLDVQGVHRRRRARGERGHARDRVQPRADDHGRRPRDRRVAPARLRHAQHAPDPRAVLQRRRDHDRPAARRQGLRPVGAPLRLRPADRDRPPGRGAGHRAPARALLRLLDGQPADRPGHRGHADADGRPRTRRSPTAASCGRRTSSSPSAGARRASRRATA